jgi:hypothetical protein
MKNKLRLVIYSLGKLDYRYVLHGSNPAVRGHVHIAKPVTEQTVSDGHSLPN